VGGSLNDEDTTTASLAADLYDSATNTMGSAGSNAFPRLYHSVSLLLPDATVWVAGGNPQRGSYEQHVEIYSPPYLFNGNGTLATRPTITGVMPSVVGYGTTFQVQTPDAASISSVVLMKNGSVTHAFDMDQRMVGLTFTAGSGLLTVTGPPNGNIAPPGYYMLFLMNAAGVPSVAKFVQVSPAPTDIPPTGTITSPASNVTILPGQSVTFAGTGSAPSGSITGYSWVFRGGSPGTSSLANPGAVTFASSGIYTVSFTVTDNAGITDPRPPTRTITVANAPAPSLTAVSPNLGNQGQAGLSVVLTGTNFLNAPSCNFGPAININSCIRNSATQITANINILASATLGARNVIVTNVDGQTATLANGFTVQQGVPNPAPVLNAASPNTATQGQGNITVTLTGKNFMTGVTCDFDSESGITLNSCTYNSATQITANISVAINATVGGHNIIVTNIDAQSATLVNGLTINANTKPITHIDFNYPDRNSLLVNGWSFVATTATSGTRNTEVLPGPPSMDYNQSVHPGTIRQQLGSGEMYAAKNNSQNTLFHALPTNWTSIRLKVAAFNPVVSYQQVGLLVYQDDDNYFYADRLFADVPSIESFTEVAGSVTPLNRLPLTNTGNLIIRIDQLSPNQYASFYSVDSGVSWTQIASATMALKNTKLAIQAGTDPTGALPTADFAWVEIYIPGPQPAPVLTAASPNAAAQGQSNVSVTLTGSNFQNSPTCNFGAGITINSCIFTSATQIAANVSVTAPATVGSRNITVTNVDGQSSTLANGFNVQQNPAPTLSAVNPNSASQGRTNLGVALTGTNFLAGPACNFGSGITVNSCTLNSSTQITANISVASNAPIGSNNVTITNFDGQSATLVGGFAIQQTVVYPAPTLSSASPNSGAQGQSNLAVTLTGTNFRPGPTCGYGSGIIVNSCIYNSATQIAANISISASATLGASNITVTNSDGQIATLTNGFTVNAATFTPILVHAGGGAYTDTLAQTWSADTGFTGGGTYTTTNAIANTPDPALYQSERYGTFTYQYAVPNGNYNVTLKFAEIYFTAAGQRLFNVAINGTQVLTNFDIVATGGAFAVVDKTFATTVINGMITIQFTNGTVNQAKISAIAIKAASSIAVQVSPTAVNLSASQTQQFTATVTGTSNTAVNWSLSPQVGTLSASGLYTAPASISSAQSVKITATSAADANQSAIATVNLQPPAGAFNPIFVHAGGAAYTDTLGQSWSADTGFSGGQTSATSSNITNTPDPSLYQTERYGNFSYTFTVPAGNYTVILKFAEIYWTSPNQRTFNVSINGTSVLTNFDIVSAAGAPLKAIDQSFNVSVTGSSITVQFSQGTVDLPKISSIAIKRGSSVNVQINPATAALGASQTQQFNATVTGSTNTAVTWTLNPQVGTVSSTGLYTAPSTISTMQTVKVIATSVADPAQNAMATVTLTGPFSPILVHAGGGAYTDTLAQTWSADTGFTGGGTYGTTSAIANTADPALYQTERYGTFTYQYSVPNGNYNVTLKFAEIYFTAAGQRLFNVAINGTQVLTNFDIVATGGAFAAVDKTFATTVTNGTITIQFTNGTVNQPKISAIQIR
jgi:hypothetical protein